MTNQTPDVAELVARIPHEPSCESNYWSTCGDLQRCTCGTVRLRAALARAYEALRVELEKRQEVIVHSDRLLRASHARADQAERDLAAARAALGVARQHIAADASMQECDGTDSCWACFCATALESIDAALKGAPDA